MILYQQRPQVTKKGTCIQGVLDFQNFFLKADSTLLLEYPGIQIAITLYLHMTHIVLSWKMCITR